MKKFKFLKQLESIDCGATCLKMISNFYGKEIDIRYLRDITFTNKTGVNFSSLIDASTKIGFETLPVKLTFEELINDVPLPAILHWKNNHYVVVYETNLKKKYFYSNKKTRYVNIADPGFGKLKLTENEFKRLWNTDIDNKGIALLFELSEDFKTEKIKIKYTNRFKYFTKYLNPLRTSLFFTFILVLLIASLNFIYPYINKELIDKGITNKSTYFIIVFLVAQLLLYTSSAIMEIVQGWIFLNVKIKFGINLLTDFLLKLMKMPLSFFENKLSSDIMLRIEDHDKIEDFFSRNTIHFVISVLSFLIFSVVLGSYSMFLISIFFVGSILSVLWVLWFHKIRRFINYRRFEIESINKNFLYEIVNGISDIKINNSESTKIKDWKKVQNELFDLNKKSLKLENIQYFGINYLTQIKNTLLISLSAFMVVNNIISIGSMLSISFIIGQLNAPLESFVMFIYSFQDAKISLERLADVYDKKDEIEIVNNEDEIILEKSINFKDVSFGYQNPNEFKIFNNLTLSINLNQTTAIVGTSGSGKTTLIKLLMKFYEPLSGNVMIDDKSLNILNFEKWREKISVVFQDGYIFSDSLKNNIVMSQNFDDIKFNRILKLSNIIEFIDRLPQKSDTKIGENGLGLSKGQQQRILIARAMYKNPEILILDEATSALDAENEKIIHDNLQQFFKGKTVLIIAHRLSTVKNADQIIVLKNGEIAETGNHQQLVQNKGDYFNLVKNQLELGD